MNPFLQNIPEEKLKQKYLMIKVKKIDVTKNEIQLNVIGFVNKRKIIGSASEISSKIETPTKFEALENEATTTSVTLSWNEANDGTRYEIDKDGTIFSNIIGKKLNFGGLEDCSSYSFRIRAITLSGVSEWSDAITASTKKDLLKYAIKDVKVSCNLPHQTGTELSKLFDDDMDSMWHTIWGTLGKTNPEKGNFLKLNFDLGHVYEIDTMEYIPRSNAGNGNFLLIQYMYSTDGKNWSPLSDKIHWAQNNLTKSIELNGTKLRYLELQVLESVSNYGSGRRITFYKKKPCLSRQFSGLY